ncbi:MAG: hypothetical protein SOW59_05750 [Corynebacterium sp.]|nr:hypothetical protein [Corynebacterium sp.]
MDSYHRTRRSPLPDAAILEERVSARRAALRTNEELLENQHPRRLPHPDYIYRRRRYAAVALAAIVLFLIVAAAGAFGPKTSTSINGDQLGPDPDMDMAVYQQHAADTLSQVNSEVYALVTFVIPVQADVAASAVEPAQRVSALVTEQDLVPVALPEPVAPATRADVFHNHAGNSKISAVVVWDNKEALEAIANTPGVWAVEAAPAGAAWGGIAIRPVQHS